MRAQVDKDLCTGCELCTQICPGVFEMDASGTAFARVNPVPPELETDAREAAASCPVEAIRIEEEPGDQPKGR